MSSKKTSSLKYFSDDSTGFRIQPKTVLIVSLVFIGLVVMLHIYSKMTASKAEIPKNPDNAQESTFDSEEAG